MNASAKGLLQDAHTNAVELGGEAAEDGAPPGTIKVEGEWGLRRVKAITEATAPVLAVEEDEVAARRDGRGGRMKRC